MSLSLSLGLGLTSYRGGGGAPVPRVVFSSTSISEDAEIGAVVATLSVANLPDDVTVSGWAITSDPDGVFDLDGSDLILDAALDYETATSHSVTVQATLSDASTVERTQTIAVLDVAPPAQFGVNDWSVEDDETGGVITITITSLPASAATITDIEYRLDGGSWISLEAAVTGAYPVSGLTDDQEYAVTLRAISAEGAGPASAPKQVTSTAPLFDSLLTEDGDRLVLETGAPIERDTTIPSVDPTDDPDPAAWLVLVQDGVTVKATVAQTRTYING